MFNAQTNDRVFKLLQKNNCEQFACLFEHIHKIAHLMIDIANIHFPFNANFSLKIITRLEIANYYHWYNQVRELTYFKTSFARIFVGHSSTLLKLLDNNFFI